MKGKNINNYKNVRVYMFLKQASVRNKCWYLRVSESSKVSRGGSVRTRSVRRVLYLRRLHLEARVKKSKKENMAAIL